MKKYLILAAFLLAQIGYGQTSSTGSITTNASNCFTTNACIVLNLPQSVGLFPSSTSVTISGSWTGTVTFEASGDFGVSWPSITGNPLPSGAGVTTATANGTWQFVVVGLTNFRVRGSAAMTGAAVVTIQSSPAVSVTGSQGLVPISQGGTGATTAAAGFAALAPTGQNGNCLVFLSGSWQSGGCYVGGYPVVNVVTDAPATVYTGGGSLTFTQGSATVTTGTQWPTSAVGVIVQYNNGTQPNFRSLVLAVGTNQITISSPFPGTTASPSYSAALGSNTWNDISDVCGQIGTSLNNHQGAWVDARGLTGSVACTWNPFLGLIIRPGGGLYLGDTKFTTTTTWTPPQYFSIYGSARSNWEGGSNTGTDIVADSTNFIKQYAANVTNAATVTVTSNSTTFTDSGATFVSNVNSAACDGTGFGHLVLATALTGLVEGQGGDITLAGFTPTAWNGGLAIMGVQGTSVEVQFGNNNCSVAGQVLGTAQLIGQDYLQGSYSGAAAGTLTTSTSSPCLTNGPTNTTCIKVVDTSSEFLATDANSCVLTCLTNCGGNPGPYTVAENISGTESRLMRNTNNGVNPGWAAATFTKTCYFQSPVGTATPPTTTTITTLLPLQSTSVGNVSYSLAPPLMAWANFGSGNGQSFAIYASKLKDFTLNCNQILNCTGFQNLTGQEQSSMDNISSTQYTTYAFENESGHSGPWTNLIGSYSSATNITPLSSCVGINTTAAAAVTRGIDSITCTVGGTVVPYASIDIEGTNVHISHAHSEGYVNAYAICQYSTMACKGTHITSPEPGINGYNGFKIFNPTNGVGGATNVLIESFNNYNTKANVDIDDALVAPHCGAGRTLAFAPNGTFAEYVLGNLNPSQSGYRYRFTTIPNVDSCVGTSNTGGNGSSTFNANYFKASSQVLQVSGANVTCGTGGTLTPCTSLTTITGLSWTTPELSAQNWSFDCKINYSQATAAAADAFGVQFATTAPTNWNASGEMQVTAGAAAIPGTPLTAQTVTTATNVVTGTPGAVGTVYQAHLWGTAELASSATPTVFNVMALTGAAADLLTIYRGSGCTIW